jgi:hypothetical protein
MHGYNSTVVQTVRVSGFRAAVATRGPTRLAVRKKTRKLQGKQCSSNTRCRAATRFSYLPPMSSSDLDLFDIVVEISPLGFIEC